MSQETISKTDNDVDEVDNNHIEEHNGNERQRHGFVYEKKKLDEFRMVKCKSYISEYDAIPNNICVQIKCIKYGCAIELGDYFRNKRKKQDFILMIGFWKGNKSNIVDEVIYYVQYIEFVSNLSYDKDAQICAEMSLITNLREDDKKWTEFRSKYTKDYKSKNNKIDIRFKRDHKKQKRIQCAISWNNYISWFKKAFTTLTKENFKEMINDLNNNSDNTKQTIMSASKAQKVGLMRNKDESSLDKYYTKPSIAQKFIDTFFNIVKPNKEEDVIIEPSAGDGAFSDILKDKCVLFSYDIEPKKSYITEIDFLELDVSIFSGVNVHCIGNPPFGINRNLANAFMKKCCEFSQSVSFILPKSYKKHSTTKIIPMQFHKIYEEDCPANSFLVNDKQYNAECVFQIWVRKDIDRPQETISKPEGYRFVNKNENPHIAITRVGGSSGKASSDYEKKSVQSNLFVRFDEDVFNNMNLEEFIKQFNEIKHEFNNTAGPRSISKSEFIPLINHQIHKLLNNI